MKKTILFIAIALVSVVTTRAQGGGGGGQQRTPEERVKQTMERLADLKLDKDQTEKTTAVFKEFYEARQKMMEELRAGGGAPDREAMRSKMTKMNDERDEKLKKIFNEDQYKKWKDEIEPSMRPQRQGGGGNN
jgi:periplasmic protein CpxP/Spy